VLLLSLYFHALPLAVLLWPFRRRLFAVDFDLIEQAGCARWGGDISWQLGQMCPPQWTAGPGRRASHAPGYEFGKPPHGDAQPQPAPPA
jgi:hypothetical protein